jgi:hypothetical protein
VYAVLTAYIHAAGSAIVEYVPTIRAACAEAMQREQVAKAGVAVVGPLGQLVRSGIFDAAALNADALFATTMTLIRTGGSKLTSSVKGAWVSFAGGGVLPAVWEPAVGVVVHCAPHTPRSSVRPCARIFAVSNIAWLLS